MNEQTPELNNAGTGTQKNKTNPMADIYDWAQSIVSAMVIIMLIFTFAARGVQVVGSSMVPTLHEGDRIIVSSLLYTPEYGDIIVLRQSSYRDEPLVKRVIATEGQTVDIDFDLGIVYVDGEALDEDYTNSPTLVQEDFDGPVTVPEGCVFVMGDNRNASMDSRDADIGFVDTCSIIGKVYLRISPLSQFGSVYG
ncbi:MAG: signal peptidase I [Oscillospiraceae bacterium]|nr:signal peptidase I [Oscillospiraceae bacterium]